MKGPFLELTLENFHLTPFQPLVIGDYQPPENFPNCCHNHKLLMKAAQKRVNEFPNCCDAHRQMAKNPLVDIAHYKTDEFAKSILSRVSYTEHHIEKMIDQTNWYDDITNYIEYIISSFGTPTFGDQIYSESLISMIELRQNEIGQNKAQKLIDYVNGLYRQRPGETVAEEIDFNELYHIYQKWLSVFPFDIQPFNKLKDRFMGIFPVIAEEPVYNPYMGFAKFRVITKGKLVEWLVGKTMEILKSANSVKLLQERLIQDTQTHEINLINKRYEVKQMALLTTFSNDEKQYVNIIEHWLSNEKEYFNEILPKLNNQQTKPTSTLAPADNRPNVFNERMYLDEVRKWFIQLAKNHSKNGEPFLTIEQVEQFIERAFVGIPFTEKLSMNEKQGDKGNIIGLFYLFYTHNMTHRPKIGKIDPSATVEKYIRLLTDHFDNWTFDEVKNNFRRAGCWIKPA